MAYQDQNIQCAECSELFVFTAGEQEYFASKNLNTPPKRCKACRKKAKSRKRNQRSPYDGEYRSPSFHDPAFRRRGRGRPPAPQRHPQRQTDPNYAGDYRSPAFRDVDQLNFEEEYRSPAFRDVDQLNFEEEYRSPAFSEYNHIKPEEEYRSPAFGGERKKFKDQRPMFQIVCVACGQEAMVPFLPEEKDDPMCKQCYKEHRELLRQERLAEQAAAAEQASKEPAADPAPEDTTPDEDH